MRTWGTCHPGGIERGDRRLFGMGEWENFVSRNEKCVVWGTGFVYRAVCSGIGAAGGGPLSFIPDQAAILDLP